MSNTLLLCVLIILVAVLIVVVAFALLRKPASISGSSDLSVPLQSLTQAIQQGHSQTAVLAEKLSQIETIIPAVNRIQVEIKALSERTSKVESNQVQVNQGLIAVGNGLTQTGTLTKGLVDSAAAIRNDLALAKTDLTELHSHTKARQEVEHRTAESIRRLEAIIAGTHSKGVAGENILETVFAKLPTEWQVRNFRVNDKPCEFGLRLPNNLVLPIDSKWAATHLLEQFIACDDVVEQQKLKEQIESVVLSKAKEVRKYIDPNLTVNFGVAAVPDAIYDLCCGSMCEAFKFNVVLISYSMFVPYLMLVFQTILKTSQNLDLEKLDRELRHAAETVNTLQEEIEGRYSRAITMLSNSRNDMSANLGKLNSQLTSLQTGAQVNGALPVLGEPVLDFQA